MANCQMPQGHPTHCGCQPAEPNRHANQAYVRTVEQARESVVQQEPAEGQGLSDEVFAAEFEIWWESDGQYVRAGGGDYEKSFAFEAWRHLYPRILAGIGPNCSRKAVVSKKAPGAPSAEFEAIARPLVAVVFLAAALWMFFDEFVAMALIIGLVVFGGGAIAAMAALYGVVYVVGGSVAVDAISERFGRWLYVPPIIGGASLFGQAYLDPIKSLLS